MREPTNGTTPRAAASEAADDPRVLALVKEYQAELDSGSRPDRTRFLARHPELADAVSPYLDGLDLLHRGAKDLTRPGPPPAARLETGLGRGDTLGEFTIVKEVGRGGMGVVYEATQTSLNRRVALKVLPAALAADQNRLRRFALEAQAAAAVSHPHIVPVYAVGEDRGVNFYAMRLIDGSPLDSLAAGIGLLAKRTAGVTTAPHDLRASGGAVPPPGRLVDLARWDRPAYRRAVARLGAAVARALDHAHQAGVIHRDVKPANLLLDRDGHVWVADFGLAQFVEAGTVTRTGATIGTLRYMSPEQAGGDRRKLDHRTDVYSLAVTLYELLVGRAAFPGDEPLTTIRQIAEDDPPAPRAVDPGVPVDLETVLLKAMQKDPRDRYETAAEFADDLERFAAGLAVKARRPWAWDRAKRWAGRHPATVGAAMVSLAVAGVAFGVTAAVVAAEQAETRKANDALAHEQAETRKAYQAERARADEAERRFRQSKEMTDLVLQISEEEIGSDSPFQGPRRRLLRAALANYRNLVADSRDDPAMHAELDRITARVDGLLTELAERREAEPAFLLRRQEVQTELDLSKEQADAITHIFAAKAPDRRGGKDGGPPPGPPPAGVMIGAPGGPLDTATRQELIRVLTPAQRQRLRQVYFQDRGERAFLDPDVIEKLDLTPDQRQHIRMILTEEFSRIGRPNWGGPGGGGPGGPGGPPGGPKDGQPGKGGQGFGPRPNDYPEYQEVRARAMERILDTLTPKQREAWRELIGKPFAPPPRDRGGFLFHLFEKAARASRGP